MSLCFLGSAAKSRSVNSGKRKSIKFSATDGERQEGDVNGAGSETVEKDRGSLFDDSKSNLGKFAREGSKTRREEVRGNGGNNADGDGAANELFAFDDVAFGGFQFA